jgi:hypothetical protein
LKLCAANRKRRLSALPNLGPYIYDVKIFDFTRSSIYIYDISRLMVNSSEMSGLIFKLMSYEIFSVLNFDVVPHSKKFL